MAHGIRTTSRYVAMFLVCALLAVSAPSASARQLTLDKVHARVLKRGLGNWVGVELSNGTCFAGRIVSIDEQSFGLQLHNDPEITPVLYSDVVSLQTGISRGAFWGITIAGFGGVLAMALIAHHEIANQQAAFPTLPTSPTQPVFP
jgi:hypothetical protein